jgi:Tfp pilus assembly protein PilN
MRAVNLLPAQITERTGLMKALPFVGAGAVPVLALTLLVIGYSGAHSVVSAKTAQLTVLRAQVAKRTPVAVTPSPSTAGLVAQRTQRRAALDGVLANDIAWDKTLREIARILPANVWLGALTVTSPTPADSATPTTAATPPSATGFTISGFALDAADVGVLITRLQLLPTLSNLSLTSTSSALVGTKTIVHFDLTAAFQPVHPAAQP